MNTKNTQVAHSDNDIPYRSGISAQRHEAVGRAHAPSPALSKEAVYAKAEKQMRLGQILVISGFGILMAGIVAYCIVGVAAEPNQNLGIAFLANSSWLIAPAQAVMAVGTLLWLAGSLLYVLGALDSDPTGPDLYF
jgi:hypothetical protein